MSEGTSNNPIGTERWQAKREKVYLPGNSGDTSCFVLKDQGEGFNLEHTYSKDAAQLGEDRFRVIYFRTQSGDICCLVDSYGQRGGPQLVSVDQSEKKGDLTGFQLDKEVLAKKWLIVGQPFEYGNGQKTGPITEIVLEMPKIYRGDILIKQTGGRISTIKRDFESRLPGEFKDTSLHVWNPGLIDRKMVTV